MFKSQKPQKRDYNPRPNPPSKAKAQDRHTGDFLVLLNSVNEIRRLLKMSDTPLPEWYANQGLTSMGPVPVTHIYEQHLTVQGQQPHPAGLHVHGQSGRCWHCGSDRHTTDQCNLNQGNRATKGPITQAVAIGSYVECLLVTINSLLYTEALSVETAMNSQSWCQPIRIIPQFEPVQIKMVAMTPVNTSAPRINYAVHIPEEAHRFVEQIRSRNPTATSPPLPPLGFTEPVHKENYNVFQKSMGQIYTHAKGLDIVSFSPLKEVFKAVDKFCPTPTFQDFEEKAIKVEANTGDVWRTEMVRECQAWAKDIEKLQSENPPMNPFFVLYGIEAEEVPRYDGPEYSASTGQSMDDKALVTFEFIMDRLKRFEIRRVVGATGEPIHPADMFPVELPPLLVLLRARRYLAPRDCDAFCQSLSRYVEFIFTTLAYPMIAKLCGMDGKLVQAGTAILNVLEDYHGKHPVEESLRSEFIRLFGSYTESLEECNPSPGQVHWDNSSSHRSPSLPRANQ